MSAFLEKKLKKEYGADSSVPYKVMNKLGYMKGSKETAKGKMAEKKHAKDMKKTPEIVKKYKSKIKKYKKVYSK